MSRVKRKLIERWEGNEGTLRRDRKETYELVRNAREAGDAEEAPLYYGQDAGLIDDIPGAADAVSKIVTQAEEIIGGRASR